MLQGTGELYVRCPSCWLEDVRERLYAYYPSVLVTQHEADEVAYFGLDVPCPVGDVLKGLCELVKQSEGAVQFQWYRDEDTLVPDLLSELIVRDGN
jgi:hypothetical protein